MWHTFTHGDHNLNKLKYEASRKDSKFSRQIVLITLLKMPTDLFEQTLIS